MMTLNMLVFVSFSLSQLVGANIDSPFAVDPEDLQLKEISENLRRVSGAVMGLTEYVMEIRNELKTIRADISDSRSEIKAGNATIRPYSYYTGHRPIRDPVEFRKQSLELADKVEKLLAMDQSPEVDLAKEELKRTVEKNFLRMLAAILVTGPAHTQERSDDIFKLMRSVLNGELDFTPVVQRLPLILRDAETNQFVNLLLTLRESERGGGSSFRHGPLSSSENTDVSSGSSRQIPPHYPIPNSPQLINNNFQNNHNIPSYLSNYQNNYNNALLQQANNNRNIINNINANRNVNSNIGNRFPPNNNNNNINNNNNKVNTNNVNNINGINNSNSNNIGEPLVDENGVAITQNPNSQLPTINSLLDAMSHTKQLIQEIPTLVEGLQSMIESLEGLFG